VLPDGSDVRELAESGSALRQKVGRSAPIIANPSDRLPSTCYFTVVTQIGLDHFGRYRDTLVPDGDAWLIKHRKVSTDWAAPNSTMARPSPGG
jgi:hypothetical protein